MYTKEFFIESTDVNAKLDIKLSSLMRMMQDVATEHAEILHIGKADTLDKGLYWVITRYYIDMIKYPKYLSKIKISTYPGDDMKFIFPRYFLIESMEGELLGRASSTWVVLNKSDHKVNLNPFPGLVVPTEHVENEIGLPEKVIGEGGSFIEERKVRYSDIDLNGHLNNTKYMEYILDMKDSSFYLNNKISSILINYEKELLDGDKVSLYSDEGNPEYIVGKTGDTNIFEVKITYQKR